MAGEHTGLLQRLRHLAHRLAALRHGGDGAADQVLGGLGSLVGLGRQVAHLVGHHGKALAGGPRTGGLHSGVQGQDVGLEGDVFNGGDDLGNLLGGGGNFFHGRVQLAHVLHAGAQLGAGLAHKLARLLGGGGGPLGGGGDIGDGGRQLLHRAGLLHGALAQSLCSGGHLIAGRGHLTGGRVDLPHGVAQLHLQGAHGIQDALEAAHIGLLVGGPDVKILVGHLCEQIADIVDDGVQPFHQLRRGPGQLGGFIPAAALGDGGLQVALHQQLHPLGAGPHGHADVAGQLQGHHDGGQNGGHDYRHIEKHTKVCIRQVVGLQRSDSHAPAVCAAHGGVGGEPASVGVLKAAKAVLALAHLPVDGGQLLEGLVALGVPLHILDGDGLQGDVGNGVPRLVDHIGLAVLAHLDGGDDIVEEGLGGHKVDHAHDAGPLVAAEVDGGCHHNGQLAGNFADQRLGDVHIPCQGLLHILTVGVILSVKYTYAGDVDDVAPLKSVHADPLVNDGPLFLRGYLIVGQLGDTACVHGYVLIGGQLLLDPLRRQHGGLAHHFVHCCDGTSIIQRNAGGSHQDQGNQDGCHQANSDFFPNTPHFIAPQFFNN